VDLGTSLNLSLGHGMKKGVLKDSTKEGEAANFANNRRRDQLAAGDCDIEKGD